MNSRCFDLSNLKFHRDAVRKIQPKLASGKLDKDFEVPALEPLALERYVSRLLVHVSQMIGLTAMICAHL